MKDHTSARATNIAKNTLIAFFLSQSLTLTPALAQTGYVKIAGQSVLPISVAADSGTVAKRIETIQEYLDNALVATKDRSPSAVSIAYVKGTPVITLGGYQVATVDTRDATAANTTPALLANQWADKIRTALSNQSSIDSYVAQLTGSYTSNAQSSNQPFQAMSQQGYDSYHSNSYSPSQGYAASEGNQKNQGYSPNQSYNPGYQANSGQNGGQLYYPGMSNNQPQGYRQGRVAYAQVGQIIPITLTTSIATQVARVGDLIQANVAQNVNIGDSVIPAGSVVVGQVTDARAGGRLTRSGELQVKFNRLRLPDGSETPINAHIVGSIAKYAEVGGDQSDTFRGETTKNKVGSVAFRGLLGAGGGAALGTAIGAIAGGGYGAGMGAWSGAAIGGGLGAADSLILRKGKDVTIPSGTAMQLQLDTPVAISGVNPIGY